MQKYTDKPKTLRYTVMHYAPMSSPAFTSPNGITAIHKPLSLSCLLSSFLLLLQICQCPVTFCCIDSLDGFCVKILFLCLFFLLVHCTVDIYHFLPWLLTIFQCSFQEKKKYIYIYFSLS